MASPSHVMRALTQSRAARPPLRSVILDAFFNSYLVHPEDHYITFNDFQAIAHAIGLDGSRAAFNTISRGAPFINREAFERWLDEDIDRANRALSTLAGFVMDTNGIDVEGTLLREAGGGGGLAMPLGAAMRRPEEGASSAVARAMRRPEERASSAVARAMRRPEGAASSAVARAMPPGDGGACAVVGIGSAAVRPEYYADKFFDIFDADHSGTLDKAEIRALFANLPKITRADGVVIGSDRTEEFFRIIGDRPITKELFREILNRLERIYIEVGFDFFNFVRDIIHGFYESLEQIDEAELGGGRAAESPRRLPVSEVIGGLDIRNNIPGTESTWSDLMKCFSTTAGDASGGMGVHVSTKNMVDIDRGFGLLERCLTSRGLPRIPAKNWRLTGEEEQPFREKLTQLFEPRLRRSELYQRESDADIAFRTRAITTKAQLGEVRKFGDASERRSGESGGAGRQNYTGAYTWFIFMELLHAFPEHDVFWNLLLADVTHSCYDGYGGYSGAARDTSCFSCENGVTERLPLSLSMLLSPQLPSDPKETKRPETPEALRLRQTVLLREWLQAFSETDGPKTKGDFKAFAVERWRILFNMAEWDIEFERYMTAEGDVTLSYMGGRRKKTRVKRHKSKYKKIGSRKRFKRTKKYRVR